MKHVNIILAFLLPLNAFAGFAENTIVHSSLGLVPIHALKQGTFVESLHDNAHKNYPIIATWSTTTKEVVELVLPDNEVIVTSRYQKFYLPLEQTWKSAYLLKPHDFLLTFYDEHIPIQEVRTVLREERLYEISIQESHNYYISYHKVLVHNIAPVVIGISFLIGEGAIEFAGVSFALGCAALGGWIGGKIWKKPSHYESTIISEFKDNYNTECFNDPCQCGDYELGILYGGEDFQSCPVYSSSDKNKEVKPTTTDKPVDEDRLKGAQAPGKPTEKDGFIPAKNWDKKKIKNPNGSGYGWPDKRGSIWIPTGPNGSSLAHGGAHWDVQHKDGTYDNSAPVGKIVGKNDKKERKYINLQKGKILLQKR